MRLDWIGICEAHSSLHDRRLRQHQPVFTSYSQGSMALGQSDCTAATRRNSRATRHANCPCGSPAISWISAAQRNRGYSERVGDKIEEKQRNGLGSNWVVCRHSVPEIRASRSPREPMCLCRGGSRTNQTAPKCDATSPTLLQPPARPTGDGNRKGLSSAVD